jgi:hypothetical protein
MQWYLLQLGRTRLKLPGSGEGGGGGGAMVGGVDVSISAALAFSQADNFSRWRLQAFDVASHRPLVARSHAASILRKASQEAGSKAIVGRRTFRGICFSFTPKQFKCCL